MSKLNIHAINIIEQKFQTHDEITPGKNGAIQFNYSNNFKKVSETSGSIKYSAQLLVEAFDCKSGELDPSSDMKLMEAFIKIEIITLSPAEKPHDSLLLISKQKLLWALRNLISGTKFYNIPLPNSI